MLAAAPAPRPSSALVPGAAVEILAPRFFPTWQTQNVAFPFVMRDGAGYRMFYAGSAASWRNGSAWDQWATGMARSKDTVRWTVPDDYEPVVRPYRFREGETVWGAQAARFDAMAAFGASVVRQGDRWQMWFTGWSGEDRVTDGRAEPWHYRIGHATSSDGSRWTTVDGGAGLGSVLGLGPTGAPDANGAAQPFVLRDGGALVMYYEAFDGTTHRIARARSADGVGWTRDGVVLEPAAGERGVRNPVVLRHGGRWELWYQATVDGERPDRVRRALSADGVTWTRDPREIELHPRPGPRPGESAHVDSVLVRPDGSYQVFFGLERVNRWVGAWGDGTSRSFYLFTEVVAR